MIGLSFLAVGLLWLALSWYLATRLPKWFGINRPVWRWAVSSTLFLLLVVGPFADHIVGMRQFQKLCDEKTGMEIFPNALNAKRGRTLPTQSELLVGNSIEIKRRVSRVIDLDTGEEIARYSYFSTHGGRIGRLVMLGGEYACSIDQPRHVEHKKFLAFKAQVHLTYGEQK